MRGRMAGISWCGPSRRPYGYAAAWGHVWSFYFDRDSLKLCFDHHKREW